MNALDGVVSGEIKTSPLTVVYPEAVEEAVARLEPVVREKAEGKLNSRWLSLKLLDADESLIREIDAYLGEEFLKDEELVNELSAAKEKLLEQEIDGDRFKDMIVSALVKSAEEVCAEAVAFENHEYAASDRKLDKILTSRLTGYPVMILLLAMVFWLTITGANYPSQLLADGLFWVQDRLTELFVYLNAPDWLHGILILGRCV